VPPVAVHDFLETLLEAEASGCVTRLAKVWLRTSSLPTGQALMEFGSGFKCKTVTPIEATKKYSRKC
jgi:hypothetical protein